MSPRPVNCTLPLLPFFALLLVAPAQAASFSGLPQLTPHRQADALIAHGQADGLFENITTDDKPRVRHIRSGMICIFERDNPRNDIHVYPTSPIPTDG